MKSIIVSSLCLSLLTSCDKFEVPEFSEPTLEITKNNINIVLDARFFNSYAELRSYDWYKAYAIAYPDSVQKTYTTVCEAGNIYGKITDEVIRSDRNFFESEIKFTDCLNTHESYTEIIKGNITLDSTYFSQRKDYVNSTKGQFEIEIDNNRYRYDEHFYEVDYKILNDQEFKINEYAKIQITSANQSLGTVNFYTQSTYISNDTATQGEDIIEGKNNTSISIKYSTTKTDIYLNNSLFRSISL